MWRIPTGTAALAGLTLPMMKAYATIGAMYSMRRHIGPPNKRVPIISFRTQQIPILTVTAQVYVMEAFLHWAQTLFSDTTIDYRVRHAVAAVVKLAGITMSNAGAIAISDRCGVQGLFAHNQINTLHVSLHLWTMHVKDYADLSAS
jgi:acyl-CoA oxidase